ncbi:hypothetical protein BDV93DRAFT_562495 [Ceratobasidium sp. AG-I]|nr:hypothetical protein BDV93DRAFT_562495 [Ceratobasidium sp. AG-I]
MGEMEISLERVEELFNERREQIDRCILDWREGLEKRLVEIFAAGFKAAGPETAVEAIEAVEGRDSEDIDEKPIVKVKDSTDSTKDLSRNSRLLLRADTIFREKNNSSFYDGFSTPCHYPGIVASEDSFQEYVGRKYYYHPKVDVDKYVRHTEAENVVKKMLAEMQMPDVAHMELDIMKRRFACGRCTEKAPMSWGRLVIHYMQRQRQWERDVKATGKGPVRHPVIFRNVHDVEWTTSPKPLVRILTVEESSRLESLPFEYSNRVRCMLCTCTGRYCIDLVDGMVAHIQDVHDVAEPIEGLFYQKDMDYSSNDISADEWRKEWDEFHDAQAEAGSPAAIPRAVPIIDSPPLSPPISCFLTALTVLPLPTAP